MKTVLDRLEEELLQNPETTFSGKCKNVVFGWGAYMLWVTFMLGFYKLLIPEFGDIRLIYGFNPSDGYLFVTSCIFAPLFEEIVFRLVPLQIARIFNKGRITLLVILFSSLLFGYGHALGVWAIPIQGIGGLLFCYVYLKNGYSYSSSVIMHFLINFSLFFKHIINNL